MQSNNHDDSLMQDDRERRQQAEQTLWYTLGVLYRWRRFIIWVTMGVGVASVVIMLLMPNWYRASARLLIPESTGGLSTAMLKNLPAAASALLGGGAGGDYQRYLSILTSRSVMEAAVDTFDLVKVYEVEDNKTPREAALQMLGDNVEFDIDMEYKFLSVAAYDTDPERAAAMANFFVRKLNDVNARLSSQSATHYRRFIERRYFQARAEMDSVLDAAQAFQKKYGVYNLPAQTEGFFEQMARLRSNALQAEIQFEVLRDQYGPENQQVQNFRDLARAANSKYEDAIKGQEQLLPVPQSTVPDVVRQYAGLQMEQTIQKAILEVLGPMYEQARLQEQRTVEAVQVLDRAVPPERKAKPKRSIICIMATLSGFSLTLVFALLYTWFQRNHAVLLARLKHGAQQYADEPREAPGVNV